MGRSRSSFHNHSPWLRSSQTCQVDSPSFQRPSKVSNPFLRVLVMTTQNKPSIWLVVSRKPWKREERWKPCETINLKINDRFQLSECANGSVMLSLNMKSAK